MRPLLITYNFDFAKIGLFKGLGKAAAEMVTLVKSKMSGGRWIPDIISPALCADIGVFSFSETGACFSPFQTVR